jgi:FkbM family methyltransferase
MNGSHLPGVNVGLVDLFAAVAWGVHRRFGLPNVEKLDESASDETVLLSVGGERIWWPMEFDQALLPLVWSEVFTAYPPNGHQYLHAGCRLNSSGWVLDIGASEGFFTHRALSAGCRVLAVEPLQRFQLALRKTFADHVEAGTVRIACCAVGRRDGDGVMHKGGSAIGARLRHGPVRGAGRPAEEAGNSTRVRTIDGLVHDMDLDRVGFIKMDVDGHEPSALAGAIETLRRDRPCLALACYHFCEEPRILADLVCEANAGYRIATKGSRRVGARIIPQVLHAWPLGRGG